MTEQSNKFWDGVSEWLKHNKLPLALIGAILVGYLIFKKTRDLNALETNLYEASKRSSRTPWTIARAYGWKPKKYKRRAIITPPVVLSLPAVSGSPVEPTIVPPIVAPPTTIPPTVAPPTKIETTTPPPYATIIARTL